MGRKNAFLRRELNIARRRWSALPTEKINELKALVDRYRFSISLGDILFLANGWYVTHSGLLRLASRHRCSGIRTFPDARFSDPTTNRWVFRAIVYGPNRSKSFVGYGDADPLNVSALVRGSELRVAETRAVNRALRKAYGIGICSIEELGSLNGSSVPFGSYERTVASPPQNGSTNGQSRLRDKLCLLIRQYSLDPNLVKAYAADFCGTEKLSGASRDMVEAFINQLAKSAKENRDSLVCKLNSYAPNVEVHV